MSTPFDPVSIRLRHGLERLSSVLRADQWSAANAVGVNPTQAQVLAYLAGRGPDGMRVKAIASHLGVSQPTATDSIVALERKSFVVKSSDPADARATVVAITTAGMQALALLGSTSSATEAALDGLSPHEQADLLLIVVKLIRSLQIAGALPQQRLCATCRHFRPFIHPDGDFPHHCAFVNAAFGRRDLRIDCGEHETADPVVQSANWATLSDGSASLQARR